MERNILRIMGFSEGVLPSKCLGAPLSESTIRQVLWKDLLDKLKQKLSLWTFRALNFRSTLILVNSVLQAMPLYLVSVLVAPKFVIKQIRNIQRKFLWGGDYIHRKWPLVDWQTVCKPKNVGGIRLRDQLDTNKAMGERYSGNG